MSSAKKNAERLIKKYPNRRLYDTQTSSYITLTHVKQLVLDADDPAIAQLAAHARGARIVTFGVDDDGVALRHAEHASDARFCTCGGRFTYEAIYMGHVGRWRCPACGRARVAPDVSARRVTLHEDGSVVEVAIGSETFTLRLPLAGLYSVYNALGAAAAAYALGIDAATIAAA